MLLSFRQLFRLLFRPLPTLETVRTYETIVRRARAREFYQAYAVPDTLDGRFELLILHMVLVLRSLEKTEGEKSERPARRFAAALFDLMFDDLDRGLRETGVGDMGVGKRIKAMGEAFYGRQKIYNAALLSGSFADLCTALDRNLYGTNNPDKIKVMAMAHYVTAAVAGLRPLAKEALMQGEWDWVPIPVLS